MLTDQQVLQQIERLVSDDFADNLETDLAFRSTRLSEREKAKLPGRLERYRLGRNLMFAIKRTHYGSLGATVRRYCQRCLGLQDIARQDRYARELPGKG